MLEIFNLARQAFPHNFSNHKKHFLGRRAVPTCEPCLRLISGKMHAFPVSYFQKNLSRFSFCLVIFLAEITAWSPYRGRGVASCSVEGWSKGKYRPTGNHMFNHPAKEKHDGQWHSRQVHIGYFSYMARWLSSHVSCLTIILVYQVFITMNCFRLALLPSTCKSYDLQSRNAQRITCTLNFRTEFLEWSDCLKSMNFLRWGTWYYDRY